ncbi:BCCT family transporter [Lysobacter soli]|uniref:BCCT family transporter n=1 Tax=Lysobacter soli TaxID=453783 RepID=UPI00209F602C|nr:BCCT family transporter [Lysobacter soli]
MVFRISIGVLALLVLAGVVIPDTFGAWSLRVQAMTLAGAGWLYLVIVFCVLAFLGYLAFSRTGQLRIGGADAEPHFSRPLMVRDAVLRRHGHRTGVLGRS